MQLCYQKFWKEEVFEDQKYRGMEDQKPWLGLACNQDFAKGREDLTRILPLYVMIVKLRQNFAKTREFSWIRGQKKIMLKIFIVYEI